MSDGHGTNELARTLAEVCEAVAGLQVLLKRLEGLAENVGSEPARAPGLAFVVNINGKRRRMTEQEVHALKHDEFDLFIDVTSGVICTRTPGEASKLRRMADTPLQAEDLNTLLVFIEHPNRFFSNENLPQFLEDSTYLRPNTLAKRMGRIRRALQGGRLDGPFIRRTSDAHFSVSQTGFAHYFDAAGVSYCVVTYETQAERNQG